MSSQSLDTAVSVGIGATAAISELIIGQPLIYFKNSIQTGTPIKISPSTLYRGFGINLISVVPVTAFQVTASGLIYSNVFAPPVTPQQPVAPPPTILQSIYCSAIAGALSGLISAPCESIILHQQQTGYGIKQTFNYMTKDYGIKSIFRGATWASMRDCPFTVCYLALGPFFAAKLHEDFKYSDATSRLLGGLFAGVLSAVITHPFDTIKTRLQHDFKREKFPTVLSAIKAKKFYHGVSARGARVVIGTCIIGNMSDILNKYYHQYKINNLSK